MELKNIVKNSSILVLPRIVDFILRIIKTKLMAMIIGTTGIGIVSQLSQVFNQLSNLSTFSMTSGTTKLIAKKNAENNTKEISRIIKTSIAIILPVMVIIYFAGFFFSENITKFILGENSLNKYFIIVFITFPLVTFSSIFRSILMGFKNVRHLAYSDLLKTVLSFLISIPLIIFFKIDGAVIAFAITLCIGFIFLYYYTVKRNLNYKGISIQSIVKANFSKDYMRELITIGSIGMFLGYLEVFVEIFYRGYLVTHVGINGVGIYAPIIAWSGLFTGFIYPAVSQYIFPRLSETKNDQEVVMIINDLIRFLTFAILPFVLLGIAFRGVLIQLFYSKDFIEASVYLPLHFFGILWFSWWYALMQIFIPTGRIKKFVPFSLIFGVITFAIIFFGVPRFGLWGWALKFSVMPIIGVTTLYIYFKKEIKLKLEKKNILIVVYSLISTLFISFAPIPELSLYFIGPLFVAGIFFFFKENEKKYIYLTIHKFWDRENKRI